MGEVVVFKTTTGEAERFTFDGDATNDEALRVWVNSLVDKVPLPYQPQSTTIRGAHIHTPACPPLPVPP